MVSTAERGILNRDHLEVKHVWVQKSRSGENERGADPSRCWNDSEEWHQSEASGSIVIFRKEVEQAVSETTLHDDDCLQRERSQGDAGAALAMWGSWSRRMKGQARPVRGHLVANDRDPCVGGHILLTASLVDKFDGIRSRDGPDSHCARTSQTQICQSRWASVDIFPCLHKLLPRPQSPSRIYIFWYRRLS